jgi:hypothetical protein
VGEPVHPDSVLEGLDDGSLADLETFVARVLEELSA